MIADRLANAALYDAVHPRLAAAFDYLRAFDPSTPDGKYPVDGDRVVAQVQSYATRPAEQKKWESHRRYLDVQYVVSGRERIAYAHVDALTGGTDYDDAKDVIHYAGPSGEAGTLYLEAGDFAIFLPSDGHRPGVQVDASADVRKVVMKVLI